MTHHRLYFVRCDDCDSEKVKHYILIWSSKTFYCEGCFQKRLAQGDKKVLAYQKKRLGVS